MASAEIDIFRDPLYEERGFIFDPERNQYYEIVEHPEYGPIRSYISPRDQSPVPLLSEPRQIADLFQRARDREIEGANYESDRERMQRIAAAKGLLSNKDFEEYLQSDVRQMKNYESGGTVGDIDIFDQEGGADQGMFRSDGSKKSARGFLGPIKNLVTGGTMTEFATTWEDAGIEIPTMVPTLSSDEVEYMQRMKPGQGWDRSNPMDAGILKKAEDHARMRIEQGKSPFYQDVESFQSGGTVEDTDIFDYLPSAGQVGYYGSMLLPGTGILEAGGGMAAPPASDSDLMDAFSSEERLPSIGENIDRGEYFDAAMQGLGVLGDAMYAIPVAGAVTGPTLGTVAKGAGALGKAGARGLESLTFSIEELTKKFMDDQPPVGSIDPEKATGAPITERDIKTRTNKYKKSLKKPAVKRREDARAAHEIQDLEAQERVIIDPNELAGYSLVPVTGDRSGIGTITDVKGVPLSFPVEVQGGPGYTQFMDYGKAWASMRNAANLKQINMIKACEAPALSVSLRHRRILGNLLPHVSAFSFPRLRLYEYLPRFSRWGTLLITAVLDLDFLNRQSQGFLLRSRSLS